MSSPQFTQYLAECPLIAIIRGVKPDEVEAVATTLLDAGIRIIEIPLNSPDPLNSIERLARAVEGRGICGAGTVTQVEQVQQVKNVGGEIIVSPNTNPDVIKATLAAGMVSLPGCLTPTDCFTAIGAGATHLKLFPIGDLGPVYFKSLMAVMPKHITTLAVGGMHEGNLAEYWDIGARGYGFGTNIYAAGDTLEQVRTKADLLMTAAAKLPRN
ncbi:2-dehydro-3-deoxy-6-phosphogalactonate aldolase [Simiduia agarivorans]|uniref:KDPG and KHG aldolase n=1 Tax=Simiduia agarivorans (strain DSM 21679 / JCM 13881 / BCRC 17597 / SA1) TaxID=1117647 RepID=K4L2U3_SIMAS|nr:2-dehydro-3-deoxy-6-phosphogalactonate aldolase [Simiduia agarivorans]AFV00518.1 KDPG and KHG aldolase [Simiduia agarivorans SA1 = DSM 21679]